MFRLHRCLLLFSILAGSLKAQSLPWYVESQYPAAGASNIPTNTSVVLNLLGIPGVNGGQFPFFGLQTTLAKQTGGTVPLTSGFNYNYVSYVPSAPLSPSTTYVFTFTPGAGYGDPYQFSFTTGTRPDTTAPKFLGFNPPSGSTGVSLNGPFTALFDKPLALGFVRSNAITVRSPSLNQAGLNLQLTPDGKGLMIEPQSTGFPTAYQVTLDPSQIQDQFGNHGQGSVQTASYTTFLATGTSGPVLSGYFPADGESGLPLNVGIRLLFDRAIDFSTASVGISVQSGSTTVAVSFESFASGRGIAMRTSKALAPNQTYTVTAGTALQDANGIALAQPASFQFTTGSVPDGTQAQILSSAPLYGTSAPVNVQVAVRTNKRIMPLALLEFNQFTGGGNPAAVPSISPDGQTFTLTPVAPLTMLNQYAVDLRDLVDVTGVSFGGSFNFTPNNPQDTVAPAVLAIAPPDGSENIPTDSTVQVLFSEMIGPPLSDDYLQLTANGQAVPARFIPTTMNVGTLITVTPNSPLSPNTTYTLQLNAVTDLAGNSMAPQSAQFKTGAGPRVPSLIHQISSTPALGDQGVDVATAITVNFDSPLNPVTAYLNYSIADSFGTSYPATATVSGSTMTITPAHPLLPNAAITVTATIYDIPGNFLFAQVKFVTGSSPDSTPLRVISVSPPDGAVLTGATQTVTLTFNKAVNSASLTGNAVTGYSNGSATKLTALRTNNDLSLQLSATLSSGDLTVSLDDEVKDIAGNPLVPFRAHYTLPVTPQTNIGLGLPGLVATRPATGTTGVPADTAVIWFFSSPVDPIAANAALVVISGGNPVPGSLSVSADGLTATFLPSAPFPAGANVQIYQRSPLYGDYYPRSFTVAATPPAVPLTIVRATPLSYSMPANEVLEFEFSADIAVGQGLLTLRQGYPGTTIPVRESLASPRVLRLTPVTPLAPGNYAIVPSSKVIGANTFSFQIAAPAAVSSAPPVIAPQANSSGTALNGSVRVSLASPLNPLTVKPGTVTFQTGGISISGIYFLSTDNRGLVVTPTQLFPPNAEVDVSISGLEDLFGNPVPAKAWSFTTGSAVDFQPLTIVEQSFNSYPTAPQIPANAPVVWVFNKPVDPTSVSAQAIRINPQVTMSVQFSDDLRTVSIFANPSFFKGQQYSLDVLSLTDLSGNPLSGSSSSTFYTAFDPDTTAPQLLQVSPADSQTGLPLNSQIIAKFDEPLLGTSFSQIQLLRGTDTVALVQEPDDLRHVRFSPARPLDPNTTYTLVITGVSDLSGNIMNGTVTRTFTTGDRMDTTPPTVQFLADGAPNAPIRVTFSELVSPATVDTQSIVLSVASNNGSSWYWIPIPVNLTESSDGLMVTVTPVSPLRPDWRYLLTATNIRDFAGNSGGIGSGSGAPTFTTTATPETTPPVVVLTPADGSTAVPLATAIGAQVSKTFLNPAGSTPFQVSSNGQPVPGTVTLSGNVFSFLPALPLALSTTYRIDFASVTDFAGNQSAPVSSTFTTSASAARPPTFQFLTSVPASGDAGVPVNSPIVLTFSGQPDPASVSPNTIHISSTFPVNGVFSISGNTVTYTPTEPWPSASTISVSFYTSAFGGLRDLIGQNLLNNYVGISFKTAVATDPTPPQFLAASPASGTTIFPPNLTFRLTFSKTVAVGPNGLTIFSGSQGTPQSAGFDPKDSHTLVFGATIPADSQFSIVGSDAIVDRNGNSIAPFTLQYPTGDAIDFGRPTVTLSTPRSGASAVAPTTPILLQFSKPMDPQTLLAAVRVTQDGNTITGKLDLSNSNQTVQFTPDQPYGPGSRIDIFVLETAADTSGLTFFSRVDSWFTVAPAAGSMSVTQTSFGSSVSADASLDVAFERPLEQLTLNGSSVWLRAGRKLISGSLELRNSRTFRFRPDSPLVDGQEYVLTVAKELRSKDGTPANPEEFRFTVGTSAAELKLETYERIRDAGNRAVHLRFSAPVNPLSVEGVHLLLPDGSEIAITRRIGVGFQDLWLFPTDPRADLTQIAVDLSGLSDRSGHEMPRLTHKFKIQ
jgi:methionine-rich copper-binding protein CopC